MTDSFDLLIIGGGVNGTAIARAAALAGQRVLLVEQGDLAQATSSASTKLMHGGLRYLEHYEFKLVHESLKERGIMLRMAPHIVRPLEFRLPHAPSMRPWPIVRIGLWLYDLLAIGGGLPRSRSVRIEDPGLKPGSGRGFSYWDGQVDDARLVVSNALDAQASGAEIATRTRFFSARAEQGVWTAELSEGRSVRAGTIVNAAGPWVDRVLRQEVDLTPRGHVRLVRGSHIVVPRCLDGDHAWLLQQPDGRIVFAIPWFDDFTLVGTTDFTVERPEEDRISDAETDYILAAANLYLTRPLTRADIVHAFAGIRPLFDDGSSAASKVTRDYRLELDTTRAPILSVFGGKITTARHLAEEVLGKLGIVHGLTETRPLPGGDIADFPAFLAQVRRDWPFLDAFTAKRMAQAYGTRIGLVLGEAKKPEDLGRNFGLGLTAREVDYLVAQEWAVTVEDVLWRRTKLGLRFTAQQAAALHAYLGEGGVGTLAQGAQ
ncbi:MAG TPA: glycerol-3-phosphate dehydrogenase [Novosphingobium sp.]